MLIEIEILNKENEYYDIKLKYPKLAGVSFSWFSSELCYRINSDSYFGRRYNRINIYNFETTLPYLDLDNNKEISEYVYNNIHENLFNKLKDAVKYFNDNYEIVDRYFRYKKSNSVINVVEKDKTYMIEIDTSILMASNGRLMFNKEGIHTYATYLDRKNSLKIYGGEIYLDVYNFKPFKSFIKKKNINKEMISKLKRLNLQIMLNAYKDTSNLKEI